MEIVTWLSFYCGWPKAWSTFPLIAEIYGGKENDLDGVPSNLSVFPAGEKNPLRMNSQRESCGRFAVPIGKE